MTWMRNSHDWRRVWYALAAGLMAAGGARVHAASASRPNIIFIFADDHAFQAIGAYGSRINKTPNIDRLAHEGMLFKRCYVTNSICGPSRAVILTGKYSHLNGFMRNGQTFNGAQQTFPKLLQKAGYQTAIVGKWHLRSTPTGFDYFDVLVGQGPYYNPPMKTMGKDGQVVTRKHTGYTTDIITDKALDWLKSGRDKSKPFMLMYQHKAPHRNWQPDPKHFHMYDDVTIPEPPTLWDDYNGRATPALLQKMTIRKDMTNSDLKLTPPRGLTPEQRAAWDAYYNPIIEKFKAANLQGDDLVRWKYQRYIKDYLRCIAAVDDNVGRVLKYLDDTGLAKNTVVIYSSDQGFYLGDHGWFDKRWMYTESLATPLIVRWPGVTKPGAVNEKIVSNLDFAETFLDIAGAPIPADMQGRSLVPLLRGQDVPNWRQTFYYHYYEFPGAHSVARHYGATDGNYKLIHYYQLHEWEMFDLVNDPYELHSVYGDDRYKDVRHWFEAELLDLRKQFGVPEDHSAFFAKPRRARRAKSASSGRKH